MIILKSKGLDYWKKKLISILKGDVLEKSLQEILFPGILVKSLPDETKNLLVKAKAYPAGTIREWGGKKYKKLSSGKWMRTYTGTGERGERQAVRIVMNKIQKAESMAELAKIVSENMQRFKDENGKTLPVVKEFLSAVRGTEAGSKKKTQPEEEVKEENRKERSDKDSEKQSKYADVKVKDTEQPKDKIDNILSKKGGGYWNGKIYGEKGHKGVYIGGKYYKLTENQAKIIQQELKNKVTPKIIPDKKQTKSPAISFKHWREEIADIPIQDLEGEWYDAETGIYFNEYQAKQKKKNIIDASETEKEHKKYSANELRKKIDRLVESQKYAINKYKDKQGYDLSKIQEVIDYYNKITKNNNPKRSEMINYIELNSDASRFLNDQINKH